MAEVLKDLDGTKAKQENDIPIKLIKKNIKIFSSVLSRMFSFYIDKAYFPKNSKQEDITPVHKKDDKNDKSNCRPVSILPSLSKASEKCLSDQIYAYTDSILSNAHCGLRKGYNAQYSINAMIEKWRRNLDQGCLVHDLLIVKLEAYDFL